MPSTIRVRAGLVDLDEVGALLHLLAHDRDDLLGVVGVVGVRQHVLRGIEVIGVLVAAQNVDGVAADAQPRPGNQSLIDGVADRRVGGAGAFGPHVALGGEAGHQVSLGGQCREDRALRHGLLHRLQILRAGMQEQMHVRVDQAGHQRHVAEIDDLRTGGMVYRRADFDDTLA